MSFYGAREGVHPISVLKVKSTWLGVHLICAHQQIIVCNENIEKCKEYQDSIGKDTLGLVLKGDRGKFHGVISNDLDGYKTLAGEDTSENNRALSAQRLERKGSIPPQCHCETRSNLSH